MGRVVRRRDISAFRVSQLTGRLPSEFIPPSGAIIHGVMAYAARTRVGMNMHVCVTWEGPRDPQRPYHAPIVAEWSGAYYHEWETPPTPTEVMRKLARHVWDTSTGEPGVIPGQDPLPGL